MNKRQKAIFKDILKNLNKDILSNLDVYLLNQTAITIERLESIEKEINNASKVTDENGKEQDKLDVKLIINLKSARDMYSKDFLGVVMNYHFHHKREQNFLYQHHHQRKKL